MTTNKREKMLLIAVGGLLSLFAMAFAIQTLGGGSELADKKAKLEEDLDGFVKTASKSLDAKKKLEAWREASLPSDPDKAQTDYKAWLTGLADRNGFVDRDVQPGMVHLERYPGRQNVGIICQRLSFTLRGQASLSQLAEFLHGFYLAGHLHSITNIIIKPVSESQKLDLTISVEAISMPDAERVDGLTETTSTRLALAETEDGGKDEYRTVIAERAIFSAYRPPAPPVVEVEEQAPTKFDNSKFAYVRGITADGKTQPEVWIYVRTTDQNFRLKVGEQFELDGYSGTIHRITPRQIQVDFGGHLCQVDLGGTFAEAEWLTSE